MENTTTGIVSDGKGTSIDLARVFAMKTRLLITWLVALGLIAAAEVQTAIREHTRPHVTGVRKEIPRQQDSARQALN